MKVKLCEMPVGLVCGLDRLAQERVQLEGGWEGEAGRCSRKRYNETSCSMKGRKKRTSWKNTSFQRNASVMQLLKKYNQLQRLSGGTR